MIAKRYAKALFDVVDVSEREACEQTLQSFLTALDSVPAFKKYLFNQSINRAERGVFINELLAEFRFDDKLKNFILVLNKNGRLKLLPVIIQEFSALILDSQNKQRAVIRSRCALSDSQLSELSAALGKKFGKEILIQSVQDDSVISGLKLEVGDLMYDSTVAGSLSHLRAHCLKVLNGYKG